ncbi:hypothetical protein AB0G87_35370 [Streptomyces asoensis]|uniref:hypothetical protein n=1 Tax=Streptomyces asoensis TaxID=249586 RepID=UPI0033CD6F10
MRQWYRQTDWAKHTTVLAAVVASVGLAVTAWGTLKSAQVADDQLAQSREQHDEDVRAQASLISFWSEPGKTVVVNGSRTPASAWLRLAPVHAWFDAEKRKRQWGYGFDDRTFWLGLLPACKRIEIPSKLLLAVGAAPVFVPEAAGPWYARELTITDASGNGWQRTYDGLLQPLEYPRRLDASEYEDALVDDSISTVTNLDFCGP